MEQFQSLVCLPALKAYSGSLFSFTPFWPMQIQWTISKGWNENGLYSLVAKWEACDVMLLTQLFAFCFRLLEFHVFSIQSYDLMLLQTVLPRSCGKHVDKASKFIIKIEQCCRQIALEVRPSNKSWFSNPKMFQAVSSVRIEMNVEGFCI